MVKAADFVKQFIGFFHTPFRKLLTFEQFAYLSCGGFMAVFDVFTFYVCYNFVLCGKSIHVAGWTFTPHVASIWLPFPLVFSMSFLLSRFVVFSETNLRKRTSLFRYSLLVLICIFLNYGLIRLFVEVCHIHPTVSKVACTIIVAGFSYVMQKYFTFKTAVKIV